MPRQHPGGDPEEGEGGGALGGLEVRGRRRLRSGALPPTGRARPAERDRPEAPQLRPLHDRGLRDQPVRAARPRRPGLAARGHLLDVRGELHDQYLGRSERRGRGRDSEQPHRKVAPGPRGLPALVRQGRGEARKEDWAHHHHGDELAGCGVEEGQDFGAKAVLGGGGGPEEAPTSRGNHGLGFGSLRHEECSPSPRGLWHLHAGHHRFCAQDARKDV
mmetsp:Transcript_12720/g.35572  ORF Transcript_12720/g.35572 Transcript_12720/m.35572 type:complete len:218 (+) Transcript_12720:938-1591(+)